MANNIAAHEAGNVVARALVAGELGYSLDEVIDFVTMGFKRVFPWVNGRRVACNLGTTWGPTLSKEMEMASRKWRAAYDKKTGEPGYETDTYWPTTMKLSRAAGADIDRWFRAQAFLKVSGPIAEAIASTRPFIEVWNGHGWHGNDDRKSLAFYGKIADVGRGKRASTINRMAAVSASLMDKPEVWAAVLALAEKLPKSGMMDGPEAVAIISSAVPKSELATLFGKAMQCVSELERTIRAATVVSMQTADRSIIAIKRRANGKTNVRELQCVFPVFAETLGRAFGDRAMAGRSPRRPDSN
jgi:hypothetical protein